jgi:hypothetical protein
LKWMTRSQLGVSARSRLKRSWLIFMERPGLVRRWHIWRLLPSRRIMVDLPAKRVNAWLHQIAFGDGEMLAMTAAGLPEPSGHVRAVGQVTRSERKCERAFGRSTFVS